jgi:hypothetical protein
MIDHPKDHQRGQVVACPVSRFPDIGRQDERNQDTQQTIGEKESQGILEVGESGSSESDPHEAEIESYEGKEGPRPLKGVLEVMQKIGRRKVGCIREHSSPNQEP